MSNLFQQESESESSTEEEEEITYEEIKCASSLCKYIHKIDNSSNNKKTRNIFKYCIACVRDPSYRKEEDRCKGDFCCTRIYLPLDQFSINKYGLCTMCKQDKIENQNKSSMYL